MIKSGNEIAASMVLNQFLEKPFFYLTHLNEINKTICTLSNDQIYELHKICTEVMKADTVYPPFKYNICFNICVFCTNLTLFY